MPAPRPPSPRPPPLHPPSPAPHAGPWVVKIGGNPADWEALPGWLDLLARAARPVVIVPGGGHFAGAVRDAQELWRFHDAVAHRMAVLAMDQYGLMLHGICPLLHLADEEIRLRAHIRAGLPTICLLAGLVLHRPEIVENWDVASDSMAAWLAVQLHAESLILVKSVGCHSGTIDTVGMAQDGLVDAAFPLWRSRFKGETWCVHRDRPDLMEAALATGTGPGCRLPRRQALKEILS